MGDSMGPLCEAARIFPGRNYSDCRGSKFLNRTEQQHMAT